MQRQNSLKVNTIFNILKTVSAIVFPLITFPYVSRILKPENIGKVNFTGTYVNYFSLIASLGIGTYAIRECSAVRKNKKALTEIASEIYSINVCTTAIAYILLGVSLVLFHKLDNYRTLIYIQSSVILFATWGADWINSAMEDFKYITIRTLLIKIIYVGSVFILIKEPSDYLLYFILTVSVIVVNAIVNILYSRNFVSIEFKELFNFKYMKENVKIGIYTIMTSMYLTFNVMYLGLMTNNTQVGFYTSAYRLYTLVLGIFTAFSSVMLPRMSNLLANGNNSEFNRYLIKSFEFVALFSVPMAVCSSILAPELIYLLCGQGYEGAILPMRIIMPALILVGIAQIIVIQVLLPMKKDNVLLVASIVGAVISIVVNILLVSKYGSVGSAIVMLSAEFVVTIIYLM